MYVNALNGDMYPVTHTSKTAKIIKGDLPIISPKFLEVTWPTPRPP